MAKNIKRIFAMVMVLSMLISALPMQALAAEEDTVTDTETVTDGGLSTDITTTTTTSTDTSTGITTVTVEIKAETTGTNSNGDTVTASSESTQTDTVQSTDTGIAYSGSESGKSEATITGTDTTTDVKYDQLLDEQESELTQEGETSTEFGTPEAPVVTEKGEWIEDTSSEKNEEDFTKDSDSEKTVEKETQEVEVQVDTETGTSIMVSVPTTGSATETKVVGGINVVEKAFDDLSQEDQAAIQTLIENAAKDPDNETVSVEYTVENEDGTSTKITVTAKTEDGKIVRDEAGNVVQYTVTKETEHSFNAENIHDGSGNAPEETVTTDKAGTPVYTAPAGDYTVGEEEIKDSTGKVIGTKVTEGIYEDGKLVGYKITETKVTEQDLTEAEKEALDLKPATQPTPKEPAMVLPEKPVAPAPVTEDGLTTTVTVTEVLNEKGEVIGYTTTTVVTNAVGEEISFQENTVYGTEYRYDASESWDPETKKLTETKVTEIRGVERIDDVTITTEGVHTNVKDVTEDIYTLVETETGTYFVYEGKVYAVTGSSTHKETILIDGKAVDVDQYGTEEKDDDDDLRLEYEAKNGYKDNYVGSTFSYSDTKDGIWKWVGFGMVSDFEAAGKTDHRVRLFKLKDGDQIRYAYCVELGADIQNGQTYGSTEYERDNSQQDTTSPWEGATGTIKQLRSVALNGFWGTDDGLGSLQAVKDLMIRNGLAEEAETLTAGMALTATQVAIWYFGAKNSDEFGLVGETDEESDFFGLEYFNTETEVTDTTKIDTINKLRNLLVRLANDENGDGQAVEITAEKTFTEAGFVVHDKVSVAENQQAGHVNYDEDEDNDIYSTDVQFKLDVSTSSFNGDLIVKVMVGDQVIGGGRLAGSAKGTDRIGDIFFDKIYPDENGVFTIAGLELAENVIIDLKLEGTQHLDNGIYVFNNANDDKNWQDFISLSKLENEVNFTMQMEFNVTDPGTADVEKEQSSWKETKNVAYSKTEKGTQKVVGAETSVYTADNVKIFGSVTTVEQETRETKLLSRWRSRYAYEEITPEYPPAPANYIEEVPPQIFRLNNQNGLETIPEEPVPLAAPVITGDNSGLWIAVVLMAMVAVVAVNLNDRKQKTF